MKKRLFASTILVSLLSINAQAATEMPTKYTREKEKLQKAIAEKSDASHEMPQIPAVPVEPTPEVRVEEKVTTPLSEENIELLGSANALDKPEATPLVAPVVLAEPKVAPPATKEAITPTPTDTLNDVLAFVYERHPQLLAEREKLKATDESVAQAVSDFRPNAEADYSKGRERRESNTTSRWGYGDTTSKGLTVTQPVFSGFSGVAGLQAAKSRVKAARADLTALEQQLLFNAIVAYTDLVEKKSSLELAQHNVDVLTKQRDDTALQFEVGEVTKTDVAQSESRLANALTEEQQALADAAIARANYMRAVGAEPPANMAMPGVPSSLIPKNQDEALLFAKEANPILAAAKQREKAFAKDIGVFGGALLPEVNLEANMRRSEGGNLFVRRNESDALTLNVTIPLYQSGAEWSRLREARNLSQQAKYTTLDTVLAVEQDTSSAWQNFVAAESIIRSSEKATTASKLALDGVKNEQKYGVRTVLDVLDAEQEYLNAQLGLLRATRNHKIQAYRLLASVGKLTAENLGLHVKAYDAKENYDNVKYQLLGW